MRGDDDMVWSVVAAADGTRIVSGGQEGAVRVWDMARGAAVGEPLRGHERAVFSVAVGADGALVVSKQQRRRGGASV
jgi:WD40 repeat protein